MESPTAKMRTDRPPSGTATGTMKSSSLSSTRTLPCIVETQIRPGVGSKT